MFQLICGTLYLWNHALACLVQPIIDFLAPSMTMLMTARQHSGLSGL